MKKKDELFLFTAVVDRAAKLCVVSCQDFIAVSLSNSDRQC